MATLLDPSARGRVILVGAGPGDPGLLTVKAVDALRSADVVVHDGLIDPRVLDLAPPQAQRISVAKRRARHTLSQDAINALIVAHILVSQAEPVKHIFRTDGPEVLCGLQGYVKRLQLQPFCKPQ